MKKSNKKSCKKQIWDPPQFQRGGDHTSIKIDMYNQEKMDTTSKLEEEPDKY